MKMNKDKVYEKIREVSQKYDIRKKEEAKRFTALEISKEINIKRNTVSHYLNELGNERKVIVINTRPVYFIDSKTFQQKYGLSVSKFRYKSLDELFQLKKTNSKESFNKFIGFDKSLKYQIKQCKSAVEYPPNGLPILICGPTGTGKSYLAQIMYEYAIEIGAIKENSPFMIFNCAEYANNPELLSANLFGYVKGAFTGADIDKPGMLEKSDGGFLFFDEVHRLNSEGQEKLFTFMDKGVFRRLGETSGWRSANIRFVFATTEDLEDTLLDTFIRRIPIIISIPTLETRGKEEKLKFIYSFFYDESVNMNMKILISRQVIAQLLNYNFERNVGQLKNTIKNVCANAYAERQGNNGTIEICLKHLPGEIMSTVIDTKGIICSNIPSDEVTIEPSTDRSKLFSTSYSYENVIEGTYEKIFNVYNKYKGENPIPSQCISEIIKIIDNCFDKLVFENKNNINDIRLDMLKKVLSNILDFMESNYGLKFYGNTVMTFSYYINAISTINTHTSRVPKRLKVEMLKSIESAYPAEYALSIKLMDLIESSLDIKFDIEDRIIFSIYIRMTNKEFTGNRVKAVIIAHGYSTASSISNVANRLLGYNVFEAFDMPIDVSNQDIVNKIKDYISKINTSNGLLILVDMGSLQEIYKNLQGTTKGIVGIVNNITTQMALDAGSKILQNMDIKTITESITINNTTAYKLIFPNSDKKKAIITTCITGIGTAIKIRDLLLESLQMCADIKVIACEYGRLKNNGLSDELFNLYDVIAVVGTVNPKISKVKFIAIENLISGEGETVLNQIFSGILSKEKIERINLNIVKVFSLKRVLNSLTILNPDRIMDHIEVTINKLQKEMVMKFDNDLKISLYVHLSCLIERLVTKCPIESYEKLEEFEECHKTFIEIVKNSFSVIENIYKVNITDAEIGYIHDILSLKIKDLQY